MAFALDADPNRRALSEAIGAEGELLVMPSSYYAQTTREERAMLGHSRGVYCLPTRELIDWLRKRIADRPAIEVAAGCGAIGKALGIPSTDNFLQRRPEVAAFYLAHGQPLTNYGAHVLEYDAVDAVKHFRPRVVVAAWLTHKYNPARHDLAGSVAGPDESEIIANCEEYIFIGNAEVHKNKPLLKTGKFEIFMPSFLYSRAMNGSPDFIACFRGKMRK